MMSKIYPAKILLFGEYTIIKGSPALAVPLNRYGGHWALAESKEQLVTLQQGLPVFLAYLEQHPKLAASLDLTAFRRHLEEGWYFASTIPGGYGAGSSGAVCAAVYNRYVRSLEKDLLRLREQLAQMEHFFHGSSSGTDPLICYLDSGVYIHSSQKLEQVTLPQSGVGLPTFFLLDTHIARETEPLVKLFLEKCTSPDFTAQALHPLMLANQQAIDQLLDQQWAALTFTMSNISRLQLDHFSEMIPKHFLEIWEAGLASEQYYLKLCGAGGGGFLLGYTTDWTHCQQLLAAYDLLSLPLFAH